MKKHFNLTLTGKLKNIGFRFTAMQAAYKYGVTGFTRIKSNGAIYIEVEGEDENLNNFLNWCKTGPVGAVIENMETIEAELKNFTAFDIKN